MKKHHKPSRAEDQASMRKFAMIAIATVLVLMIAMYFIYKASA